MVVKYRVKMVSSDRWSGRSYWCEDFDTYDEAEKRVETVNAQNTAPTAPDYYEQAEKNIEAIKVE